MAFSFLSLSLRESLFARISILKEAPGIAGLCKLVIVISGRRSVVEETQIHQNP